ncbi:adenosine receptor A2a-like [Branchiostoma floridae]|uniref:Adenosine receptor A2a-like n=1 Tax=Branchiostoma floridae TaxID=7739 RepID=A0A9J7MSJ6_BRAFL|nr:adenosine receptor A2a-like [Branchiostoma floridae]
MASATVFYRALYAEEPDGVAGNATMGMDSTTAFYRALYVEEPDGVAGNVTTALPDSENKTVTSAFEVVISTVSVIYSLVGTVGNGLVILAFCSYRQVCLNVHIIPSFLFKFFTLSTYRRYLWYWYIHVTKSPDTYRKLFSPIKSFLWVLVSWVVSVLLVVPGFLGYGEFGWSKDNHVCLINLHDSPYSPAYVSNIYGLFYLLVFCVVIAIYTRIYFFVKDSVVTMAAANQHLANREQYVSQRVIQRTKHMFLIFGAFTVCSAPSVLLFSINVHEGFLPKAAIVVLFMLYRMNYVLNPFLYAWKLPVFRRAFKALVRCKRQLPFQPGAPVN